MADDINQKIGFDVDDGIANLDRLGKSISKVSGNLTRFGKNFAKFNQLANGTSTIDQTTNSVDRLGESLNRAGKKGRGLTTSLELLSRIVYTQTVIKSLRLTEQALADSVSRAAELQIKLAEISGVAGQGVFSSQGQIGDTVDSIAKSLGIPQLEIADGLYTTIQNQIGKTRDELVLFNTVAGKFSVASLTTQEDSIKLLSGTLNAYGLGVSRTEEIASKFNKAIELGAIEGSDLAHSFGRISTRAAELGITFEETLGLLETLTIKGINPNEATTQIGALISAFTKPSEEMKKTLERLKVPSGQFLIQSKGISEALRLVTDQAGGSSAALAKLFPNIRAVNGVSIVASDGLKDLAANIQATKDTAIGLNDQRYKIIFETDAQKVKREINTLQVELTKFGAEVIRLTANTLDYVGGAETLVKTAKLAIPVIEGLTAAAVLNSLATAAAARGTTGWVKAAAGLEGLAKFTIAATAASAAATFAVETFTEKSLEGVRRVEAAQKAAQDKFARQQQRSLAFARSLDDARIKGVLNVAQKEFSSYQEANSQVEAREASLVASTEGTLARILKTRKDIVKEIERTISDSQRTIEASQRRVVELLDTKGRSRFDRGQQNLSDPDQANRLLSRSIKLAAEAQKKLSGATNENQINRALDLFSQANSTANEARAIADRVDNRSLENKSVSVLNTLTEKQIAAEKRLQLITDQRRKTSAGELENQKAATDEITAQTKIILDNLKVVGQNPADSEKRQKAVQDAFSRLSQASLNKGDVSLADSLGLTQLAADIQRNLGADVKLRINTDATINDLQSQLKTNFEQYKLRLNFDVSGLGKAIGQEISNPDQLSTGLQTAKTEADQIKTRLAAIDQERFKDTKGTRQKISELLNTSNSTWNSSVRAASLLGVNDGAPVLKMLDDFKARSVALAAQSKITRSDVQGLFDQLKSFRELSGAGDAKFGPDLGAMSDIVGEFNKIQKAQGVSSEQTQLENRLRELTPFLNEAPTSIKGAFVQGAEVVSNAITTSADVFVSKVSSYFGTAFGQKTANFAVGGLARGSDTVPAMLTPGERVINAKQSQRWASDLQRINAGMNPQYRSAGGAVDNSVSVGDVHIHGTNQNFTPRDIARAISREVRRKTVR